MTKQGKNLPQKYETNDLIGMDGELNQRANVPTPDTMHQNYADKKRNTFRPRSPELHFTTSLYIDRAVEFLYTQAEKANDRRDLLIIKCTINRVDADRVRFKLDSTQMGNTTAKLKGTMQRWQGSRTRVDINTYRIRQMKPENRGLVIAGLLLFLILTIIMLISNIHDISQSTFPNMMKIFGLVYALGFFIACVGMYLNHNKEVETYIPPKRRRSDLNELVDILVNAYGEHDLQWINK